MKLSILTPAIWRRIDKARDLARMVNHYADVAAFNEACGVYCVDKFADPLPPAELAMRRRLVMEEYNELMAAIKANDRVEIADACADLAYVAIGWCWACEDIYGTFDFGCKSNQKDAETCAEAIKKKIRLVMADPYEIGDVAVLFYHAIALGEYYGFPMDDVWREVQRSNMAKVVNGKVNKRADGKIIKPPGWTPPDIRGILERAGAL